MIIDCQVYIRSHRFPEAEWEGNGEVLVWTSTGARLLIFGVSEREFLELQRTADHEFIVKLIKTHRCQWT